MNKSDTLTRPVKLLRPDRRPEISSPPTGVIGAASPRAGGGGGAGGHRAAGSPRGGGGGGAGAIEPVRIERIEPTSSPPTGVSGAAPLRAGSVERRGLAEGLAVAVEVGRAVEVERWRAMDPFRTKFLPL